VRPERVESDASMNRKRAVTALGLLAIAAILMGGMAWSLRYQPMFYQRALAQSAPPEMRRQQAREFVQTTLELVDGIRNEDRWSHEFSEDAVNGWLAEELPVKYAAWLPPEVAAPRVKFEKDSLLLAFQGRQGMWRGVVSARVKPWVAGPNQLALEIQSLRIGLVPVPLDEILGEFVRNMNSAGWRMQWRNIGKKDVLVVDLDEGHVVEDRDRPVLEVVELEPNHLQISGRRTSAADAPRLADKPETH
jgi:hypothetical protein